MPCQRVCEIKLIDLHFMSCIDHLTKFFKPQFQIKQNTLIKSYKNNCQCTPSLQCPINVCSVLFETKHKNEQTLSPFHSCKNKQITHSPVSCLSCKWKSCVILILACQEHWEHAGVCYITLHFKTASPYGGWSHFMDTWISICKVQIYLKFTCD